MCNNKCYDIIAAVASVVVGIIMTVLLCNYCECLFAFGPMLGGLFSAFALFLTTLAATTLLRQDKAMNACVCRHGQKVLIPAILLLAVSMFGLVIYYLGVYSSILTLALTFLLAGLITYLLFSLYCFLSCLVEAGCPKCGCGK